MSVFNESLKTESTVKYKHTGILWGVLDRRIVILIKERIMRAAKQALGKLVG